MELVGAPLAYVRGPFIAEGVLQGGGGALAAIAALWPAYVLGRRRLGAAAADAFGAGPLVFLPVRTWVLLVIGGMVLGCLGGLIAARRLR